MPGLVTVVLSSAGIALVPFIGWISQRWTRESRLILRVNRIGSALAHLPPSSERSTLESEVLRAVRVLNEWIDPVNKTGRKILRGMVAAIFVFGVAANAWIQQAAALDATASFVLSLLTGSAIAVASIGSGALVQKAIAARREKRESARRIELLERGEYSDETLQ